MPSPLLVAQRQFRGALIAQPEKFDAPRRLFRFAAGCTGKNFGAGIQTEQLSLMQIKKSGRAARIGAFGEHFCLLSGGKILLDESYSRRSEMQPVEAEKLCGNPAAEFNNGRTGSAGRFLPGRLGTLPHRGSNFLSHRRCTKNALSRPRQIFGPRSRMPAPQPPPTRRRPLRFRA